MGGRLWSGISKSPLRTSRRPTCWTSFRTRHNSWRTITSTSLRKRHARVADLLGVKPCPQTKAHLGRHRLPLAQKERRQKPSTCRDLSPGEEGEPSCPQKTTKHLPVVT